MRLSEIWAIAEQWKLHVRRESWEAGRWWYLQRGVWWTVPLDAEPHPVRATEYSDAELLADDWTTMPAALAACVINPGTGSTGGGPPATTPGGGPGAGNGSGAPGNVPSGGGAGTGTGGSGSLPPVPGENCVLGSGTLTLSLNCELKLSIHLECAGFSAGNYSVVFTVPGHTPKNAGLQAGPDFEASNDEATMDPVFLGRTITVTATVTGMGAGACKGRQTQFQQTIQIVYPEDCAVPCLPEKHDGTPAVGLRVAIGGVTGNRDLESESFGGEFDINASGLSGAGRVMFQGQSRQVKWSAVCDGDGLWSIQVWIDEPFLIYLFSTNAMDGGSSAQRIGGQIFNQLQPGPDAYWGGGMVSLSPRY